MFKNRLPQNGRSGYEAFGLIVERDKNGNLMLDENGDMIDRPVGFSKRRIGFKSWGLNMVGLNCAFCHASTVRKSERDHDPDVILGMPANTVDVEEFLVFLFNTAKDPRFTGSKVMKAIEEQRKDAPMGFFKATLYRWIVIPLYRFEMGKLESKFCFIKKLGAKQCATTILATEAGPGRLDLWAPYKVQRFDTGVALDDLLPDLTPPMIDSIDLDIGRAPGAADIAPLWQLEKRIGRGFHWDGNTLLLNDYKIIAALGLNVIPRSMDVDGLNRIVRWAKTHVPKKYDEVAPVKVNSDLSEHGKKVYFEHCASCHDPGGRRFGRVEPIESIGTDRNRLDAFTEELANKLKRVGPGYQWRLRNFEKTNGYSNLPLDGIWLRAPYLHNGSVPNLRALLEAPANRPPKFCRGNDEYDWDKIGFKSDLIGDVCGKLFPYDTTQKGNSNTGHEYGTSSLSPGDKDALIEYLKTL